MSEKLDFPIEFNNDYPFYIRVDVNGHRVDLGSFATEDEAQELCDYWRCLLDRQPDINYFMVEYRRVEFLTNFQDGQELLDYLDL